MMKSKQKVNNDVYRRLGHIWWDEEQCGALNLLRFVMNPVRTEYFRRMIDQARASGGTWQKVLDVGCGGGYLSEEFAKLGFEVTGVDPVQESLECARRHAEQADLPIAYIMGSGERLPFGDASFDIVLCCDVLEHVDAPGPVLAEIARVLRPNGLFCYDTVNRTFASWLGVIKMMGSWQPEPNVHVWHKFIKPRELVATMAENGLEGRDMRGMAPTGGILSNLRGLYRLARGKTSYRDLGQRMRGAEVRGTSVAYMGYAVRKAAR
ncbi:MAG: bifunctional 2-polyprenyl-6-hydroxyphenol methylase/3-demethylubiquinol 3-O-methyltransferase UbiG [Humidesulfovibrio sp.]|nr:bifunctional 2-polyprenyl-6-hydroxyphenol methylase/3-demethylubiquinol 3-O-methyltransferase UbiG [Humidesulfovibrio sp.]